MPAEAFVVGALIELPENGDAAAIGAAVTEALCGSYDHAGPCRWPHTNAIDASVVPARFRTLYVAEAEEADGVEGRIREALASTPEWSSLAVERLPVSDADGPLAARLLLGPRA